LFTQRKYSSESRFYLNIFSLAMTTDFINTDPEINTMEPEISAHSEPDLSLEREIAALIVSALNLDIEPESIVPGDPLYGDQLGIDSIDILEIALVMSKQYGVQMKADSTDNAHIFTSMRTLAAYISEHRTK